MSALFSNRPRCGKRFLGTYPVEDIDRLYGGYALKDGRHAVAVRTLIGTVEWHPMESDEEAIRQLEELGCTVTMIGEPWEKWWSVSYVEGETDDVR